MERTLDFTEIRTMNDLRPAGYWRSRIGELCDRIEELERENADLRARTQTELAALACEWRDVIKELLVSVEHDAAIIPPDARFELKVDIHPFLAGKLSVLRHFSTLAAADVARFTDHEEEAL